MASTSLFEACKEGRSDVVQARLNTGAEVDWANTWGETPLFIACQNDHREAARLLLEQGAEVDQADVDGRTPLFAACGKGQVDLARLLLGNGAEVDGPVSEGLYQGQTPLYVACGNGHVDAARLLLDKGAKGNRATRNGNTPLSIAKKNGHSAVVALLEAKAAEERRQRLAAEAQAAEAERKLRAAEAAAADKKRREAAAAAEAERRRRAANEAINAFDNYGYTKLNWAAYKGDVRKTRELLQAGADPNIIAKGDRMTPLAHAAWAGHPEIAQILLNHPWMDVKKFGKHALRMANLPMDSGTRTWASDCNFGGLEGRKAVGDMIRARCPDVDDCTCAVS